MQRPSNYMKDTVWITLFVMVAIIVVLMIGKSSGIPIVKEIVRKVISVLIFFLVVSGFTIIFVVFGVLEGISRRSTRIRS